MATKTKTTTKNGPYDPKTAPLLAFERAVPEFLANKDSPRDYLERCLDVVAARESELKAFVTLNEKGARQAADESTARYKAGKALSPIDGIPMAIKDVFETFDMPTQMGSPSHEGWQSARDAAAVAALRQGGAVILGKTVTTEFACGDPGPARNPWNPDCTPGGSSSGSGAAVGASMAAAAIGTQVRGSVLRPAAYCGAYAVKPSWGTINTLGSYCSPPSINHVGVIAGTLEDTWAVAHHMSWTAGGDPGQKSLPGGAVLAGPEKPRRIVKLETLGWNETDETTREIFNAFLDDLANAGVEVAARADDPGVEALEAELDTLNEYMWTMVGFEGRWPMLEYFHRMPDKLGSRFRDQAARCEKLTVADYHVALDRRERLRGQYHALKGHADAFVTLSSPGPAPEGMSIGDPVFGDPCSQMGVPAFTLPLLAVGGMPQGVQMMGYFRGDERLAAHANWLAGWALRGEN